MVNLLYTLENKVFFCGCSLECPKNMNLVKSLDSVISSHPYIHWFSVCFINCWWRILKPLNVIRYFSISHQCSLNCFSCFPRWSGCTAGLWPRSKAGKYHPEKRLYIIQGHWGQTTSTLVSSAAVFTYSKRWSSTQGPAPWNMSVLHDKWIPSAAVAGSVSAPIQVCIT